MGDLPPPVVYRDWEPAADVLPVIFQFVCFINLSFI